MIDKNTPLARVMEAEILRQQAIDKTWYSYAGQRQLIYKLASQLRITYDIDDMSNEECIDIAENFVDAFYHSKINPTTRG